MKKILFVCTGNTCRSPMAEELFNHLADPAKFTASSCGIFGDGTSHISYNAKTALSELSIDSDHISTKITKEMMEDADYVIGMTQNHACNIVSMFPQYSDKVFAMPVDIGDPFGGDLKTYRNCRDEIAECIKDIIMTLSGDKND